MQSLMEFTAETGASVILSSHLVADLERVCDYLIVLAASRVLVAGDVDDLLASHPRLIGARDTAPPAGATVVQESYTERQTTLIVRSSVPVEDPGWTAERLDLEDLVLAYMAAALPDRRPAAAAL
jgi:ABC-2 type transport system ATP-binding protein